MEWQANSGKFSINISLELAIRCTRPGDNQPAVELLINDPEIAGQLDKIKPEDLVEELRGYGAWSDHELASHGWNRLRIVWLACCDLVEEAAELARYPGGRGD